MHFPDIAVGDHIGEPRLPQQALSIRD